ncbi:MAG: thioredoxin domain-containing protein [Pseudomonadota bacterium]
MDGAAGNLLGEETSPYLLQHADNPVHWRAWGEPALAEARAGNKPILLSVGYAACHWCHVMAHESFENEAIAAQMNDGFVNIKVDREERPDIDQIYQHALALLGEQGGWPLTMFLTPDGEPFWGGTYFPPTSRWGRPGFPDVLRAIADTYQREPEKVTKNVTALRDALAKVSTNRAGDGVTTALLDQIATRLIGEIDPVWGGVGRAPKFPQTYVMDVLWRAWRRTKDERFHAAVTNTLTHMCQGGIYDHLGGGFARYSTDTEWLAPHFEKMLYDNAQLIDLLSLVGKTTGAPLYRQRLEDTVGWVLREMVAEGGGFAATLDADSEGEEGRFYVWNEAEIDALLGDRAPLFKQHYEVTADGNWEGKTILNRRRSGGLEQPEVEAQLADARATLLAARDKRIWPGWDDKVLADWNGLMIAALAEAGMVWDRPDWLAAARTAYDFVTTEMQRDGRLLHAWRHGRVQHAAMLDDYVNMTRAALRLYEATGGDGFLAQAESWVAVLHQHYWDDADGGYFYTADDAEALIVRTKTAHDNAVPSGNGTMIAVLSDLSLLTGKEAYRDRAEAIVKSFAGEVNRNFFPLATLLNGAERLARGLQIVIVGDREDASTTDLMRAVLDQALPDRLMLVISPDDDLPTGHPAAGKGLVNGKPAAYICEHMTCQAPLTEPNAIAGALTP